MSLVTHNIMNNSICTLFDNILIDIHKFKSLQYMFWGYMLLDTSCTHDSLLLSVVVIVRGPLTELFASGEYGVCQRVER